jgi:dsRNA-specific ribonuclease
MKRNNAKKNLIEQLKKMPIIQISCERTNVARSSFYRWRAEDKKFAKEVDMAILEGEALITDMSESQLISLIHDRNFQALQLWLRHHHPKYTNKVEITAQFKDPDEKLNPEQKAIIKKALRLASLSEPIKKLTEEKHGKSEH